MKNSKEPGSEPVVAYERERPVRRPRRALIDAGRLKAPPIPGYRLYWCPSDSDHAYEYQARLDNWWEPVLRKEVYGEDCYNPDSPVCAEDSAQLKLLKLPEELAKEDDRENKERADAPLKALQLGQNLQDSRLVGAELKNTQIN